MFPAFAPSRCKMVWAVCGSSGNRRGCGLDRVNCIRHQRPHYRGVPCHPTLTWRRRMTQRVGKCKRGRSAGLNALRVRIVKRGYTGMPVITTECHDSIFVVHRTTLQRFLPDGRRAAHYLMQAGKSGWGSLGRAQTPLSLIFWIHKRHSIQVSRIEPPADGFGATR